MKKLNKIDISNITFSLGETLNVMKKYIHGNCECEDCNDTKDIIASLKVTHRKLLKMRIIAN